MDGGGRVRPAGVAVRLARSGARAALLVGVLLMVGSCSVRRMVASGVGNAIAYGADVYATDDDPELVRDAIPFGLKTIESLLQVVPKHRGLLLAACRGFTQYAYAFVQLDADLIEPTDYLRATELRDRALNLYLRGRDYGLRGLERRHRGIAGQLTLAPRAAAARLRARDVPLLYWTAAAWGSAISLGKDRPGLIADLPAVLALMRRGLALEEDYEAGALHEAMIVLEALPAEMGGSVERARGHFRRAVELSGGMRAGPFVTLAQSVSVMTQRRDEFEELLSHALALDPDRDPSQRLVTLLLQRRARALLARQDDLFLDAEPSAPEDEP